MIPMPERIARLPTYKGRPVPVTALTFPDGTVDFRVNDTDEWHRVVKNRLCGVCGERLGKWFCFLGGPVSARSRAFTDAPMHEECARYSAQACPYLAGQKAYADIEQITEKHAGKAELTETPMMINTTSPLRSVWMVKTERISIHNTESMPVLVAQEPVEVECLR